MNEPSIRIGTSAFTADGWPGIFYPADLNSSEYLSFYATKFSTVEVDSTFYRVPSANTVQGWYAKTPEGFLFAAKVPHEITHEKVLVDCNEAFKNFLTTMSILGEKLGPLLLQFPYFNRQAFGGVNDFLVRLVPFLKRLPTAYRFAVEIRNKHWLVPRFIETLRGRNVALALLDQGWMPRPAEWFDRFDPITTDFTYVRWLGDRKGIEEQTKTWDKVIIDRTPELTEWAGLLRKVHKRRIQIFAFANNHYAGHAPETVRQFLTLWDGQR